MEKLDKVIAGLECCSGEELCKECQYYGSKRCIDELMMDALDAVRGLQAKYASAVEMAAIATEMAAAAKKVDGDLISRSELLKFPIRRDHYDRENGNPHFINGIETVMEYAEALPAVAAEPVVHAHWQENEQDVGWYKNVLWCSNCGKGDSTVRAPICRYCGAHMDEEVADG